MGSGFQPQPDHNNAEGASVDGTLSVSIGAQGTQDLENIHGSYILKPMLFRLLKVYY